MTVSVPLHSLASWLRSEIRAASPGTTAVLAGHFAIFTSGGGAVDLLDEGLTADTGPEELLEFTRFTWDAACEAIAAERERLARLLVLVDDIQFVRPALEDRSAAERLGAALAADYLRRHTPLPAYHARVLHERGLGVDSVLAHSDRRWLFSERELRTALVDALKARLRPGEPRPAGLTESADQSMITVADPEYGEYCLVHSGHTNCAGGFVELLSDVRRRGVARLIALVPMRCLGPITVGTALATRLFALQGLEVVNVAVPDVSTGASASVTSNN
ncbi:MAG: hypothetical protein ACHQQ3_04740 [Gemmatimonadales bacterium]